MPSRCCLPGDFEECLPLMSRFLLNLTSHSAKFSLGACTLRNASRVQRDSNAWQKHFDCKMLGDGEVGQGVLHAAGPTHTCPSGEQTVVSNPGPSIFTMPFLWDFPGVQSTGLCVVHPRDWRPHFLSSPDWCGGKVAVEGVIVGLGSAGFQWV
jgi:hypothetical protein